MSKNSSGDTALAKDAFNRIRTVLTNRKISISLKIRLLKAFVWFLLLYGCETWTLTAETKNNIQAAEMWFYRRMLRISYKKHITNTEVLNRVQQIDSY